MKKLLVIMLALVMVFTFAACGGGGSAPAEAKKTEFTAQQQALAQEFLTMTEKFDKVVDRINASPELLSDEELVNSMNALADEIIAADDHFDSPETLTPEVMAGLKEAIAAVYSFVDIAETSLDEFDNAKEASNASAITVPVEIFNGTGKDIHALALSPANDNSWGGNLITEVIKNGEMAQGELVFTADTLVWDILVQDGSGTQLTFMGVDFSEANADGAKLILEATEGGDYFASVN